MRNVLATAALLFSFASAACAGPEASALAEQYIKATQDADFAALARITDGVDLTILKGLAVQAYEIAAALMQKKGQVSSMVFTGFDSLDALTSATPEDIYTVLRKKTTPSAVDAKAAYAGLSYFHSFEHDGKEFLVIKFSRPQSQRDIFQTIECSKGPQLKLRLEPMFLMVLEEEIKRNTEVK